MTIDAATLAPLIGADPDQAARLLALASARIDRYAPAAPDEIANEAMVRFAGYLAQSDFGGFAEEEVGPIRLKCTVNHAAASATAARPGCSPHGGHTGPAAWGRHRHEAPLGQSREPRGQLHRHPRRPDRHPSHGGTPPRRPRPGRSRQPLVLSPGRSPPPRSRAHPNWWGRSPRRCCRWSAGRRSARASSSARLTSTAGGWCSTRPQTGTWQAATTRKGGP